MRRVNRRTCVSLVPNAARHDKLTILSTLTTVNRVDLDLGILRMDGRRDQDDLAVVRRDDRDRSRRNAARDLHDEGR